MYMHLYIYIYIIYIYIYIRVHMKIPNTGPGFLIRFLHVLIRFLH